MPRHNLVRVNNTHYTVGCCDSIESMRIFKRQHSVWRNQRAARMSLCVLTCPQLSLGRGENIPPPPDFLWPMDTCSWGINYNTGIGCHSCHHIPPVPDKPAALTHHSIFPFILSFYLSFFRSFTCYFFFILSLSHTLTV